jgi:hypothetical protein
MTFVWFSLALLSGLIAAFYLQIITLFPRLGLWIIHRFEPKRWAARLLFFVCLFLFVTTTQGAFLWVGMSLFSLLAFMSFFNDNTKGFRALNQNDLAYVDPYQLDETAQIAGVHLDKTARAYPIESVVIPRHLVNDVIDGQPILVSYCAACRSCMVYARQVDNLTLHFEVIAVWRRNMIMRDKETGTLWQQATGEALYGELKGQNLPILPAQQMQLGVWNTLHETTDLIAISPNAPKARLPEKALHKMLKVTEHIMTPGFTPIGNDLPLRETVFGVEIGGISKAYPMSELIKQPNFEDKLGAQRLSIQYDVASSTIIIHDSEKQPVIAQRHWWFGWKEFHPFTEIWRAEN